MLRRLQQLSKTARTLANVQEDPGVYVRLGSNALGNRGLLSALYETQKSSRMVDQSTLVTCILWHDCRLPIGLLAKVVSNAARPANEVSRLAENAFPLFTYIAFPSTVPELLFFAGENLFVMRLRDGLSSHLSYILSKSLTGDDRATPVLDLCRMGLLVLYPTAADVVEERCIQVE